MCPQAHCNQLHALPRGRRKAGAAFHQTQGSQKTHTHKKLWKLVFCWRATELSRGWTREDSALERLTDSLPCSFPGNEIGSFFLFFFFLIFIYIYTHPKAYRNTQRHREKGTNREKEMDKTWLERNSSTNHKVETYGGQKKQGEGIWQQEQPQGEKIGSRDRTGREKGGVWCEEAGGNYWLLQQQHRWFGEKEGMTGSRGSFRKGRRSYKTLVDWTLSSVLPALLWVWDQSWVFYTL